MIQPSFKFVEFEVRNLKSKSMFTYYHTILYYNLPILRQRQHSQRQFQPAEDRRIILI